MPEIHEIVNMLNRVRISLIEANAKVKKLKDQKAFLDQAALEYLTRTNTTGVDTPDRKWFKKKQTNFTLADAKVLYEFIVQHDRPDMLQKRVNGSAAKEYFEEHQELPPGVSSITKEVFTSRAK